MRALARITSFLIAGLVACTGAAAEWTLEHVAGGGPDGIPALEANLAWPRATAVDGQGNVYIVVTDPGQVLRVDPSGIVHAFEQSGQIDTIRAELSNPVDMATRTNGDFVFVSEQGQIAVRDSLTGEFETYRPRLNPIAIEAAPDGSFYLLVTENWHGRVYRFEPESGATTVVAGIPCSDFSCGGEVGEGVPATAAALFFPSDIALDSAGALHVAEAYRIRRIDVADGTIWTVAGDGTGGFSGDGGPALDAQVLGTAGLTFDAAGNLYFADRGNARVRRVDVDTGVISTIAGNGVQESWGDGGPALDAALERPQGTSVDAAGNVYVASEFRVRRIDAATGIIDAFAGNGSPTFSGDGHAATGASFSEFVKFTADEAGNLFIADTYHHRVRRVDAETGVITTIAGNGDDTIGVDDDGVPAIQAVLPRPDRIQFDPDGNLYVYVLSNRMRKIDAETERIETLPFANWGAFDPFGDLYVAGPDGRIVRVDPATGETEWVAGNGDDEFNGEGVPALEAGMWPGAISFDGEGNLYYTDVANSRVRRIVRRTGLVETVVGGWTSELLDPWFGADRSGFGPVPAIGSGPWGGWVVAQRNGDLWADPGQAYFVLRVDAATGLMTSILGTVHRDQPRETELERLIPRDVAVGRDDAVYVWSGRKIYRLRNVGSAPIAVARGGGATPCEDRWGARVTLDGSLSFDPDDVSDEPSQIVRFWWYEDFGQPAQRVIARGPVADVRLPIGQHDITLFVRDDSGLESTDAIEVRVVDASDPDGDGFGSCVDTCPEVHDPDQVDADGNGLGDLCDPCADEPFDDADADAVCSDADNCPDQANPDQADADGDLVGDACDNCPDMPNADQAANGTCVTALPLVGECRAIRTDAGGAGRRGRLLLSEVDRPVPTSMEFVIQYNACDAGDEMEFLLNGTRLGVGGFQPTESCGPWTPLTGVARFMFDDAEFLESLWRKGRPNELVFAKTGESAYLGNVLADLGFEDHQERVCFFGFGSVCDPSSSASSYPFRFEQTVHKFAKSSISDTLYGPQPPSSTIHLPPGQYPEYQFCVSSTRPAGPQTLHASTEHGALLELDPFDATTRSVGTVPIVATDIEFDRVSGSALAVGGSSRAAARFDIRDGSKLGGLLPVDRDYQAAEYVQGGLIGAIGQFSFPQSTAPSLHWIDFGSGSAVPLPPFLENGFPRGLAYDEVNDELWSIFSGTYMHYASMVRQIDLEASEERITGLLSLTVDGLEFGPDGLLYSVHRSTNEGEGGTLYYIDTETMLATPVGDTGYTDISGLTLAGPQGTIDCVVFPREGEQRLAINASCGPPVAQVAAIGEIECDTPEGGVVTLDGSASSDPNSSPGTDDGLVSFDWYEDYGLPTEVHLGSGPRLTTALGLGDHMITLRVTNLFDEVATTKTTVAVVDSVPPEISVALSPTLLWPPNHRIVQIVADVLATDACGDPVVRLARVTSDEPDDHPGGGDGHTTGDIQDAAIGEADMSFGLRAERAGSGDGRVYEIVYEAIDAAGHRVEASAVVEVPHSAGAVEPAPAACAADRSGTTVGIAPASECPVPSPAKRTGGRAEGRRRQR